MGTRDKEKQARERARNLPVIPHLKLEQVFAYMFRVVLLSNFFCYSSGHSSFSLVIPRNVPTAPTSPNALLPVPPTPGFRSHHHALPQCTCHNPSPQATTNMLIELAGAKLSACPHSFITPSKHTGAPQSPESSSNAPTPSASASVSAVGRGPPQAGRAV